MKEPYSANGKNTSRLAKIGSTVSWPSPCRPGVMLKFKMLCIESADLETKTYKSCYNKRSVEHLGLASVIDIYPEISENGFNTSPAIGVLDTDGKIGILAGLKRRKAVSLVDNGKFYIHVCTELSEAEMKAYAISSDIYSAPTVLDFGYTLKEYSDGIHKAGRDITYDELAEIFNVSKGKVSEAIAFANLPKEFIRLFPSLESMGYRYLREILKLSKDNKGLFIAALECEKVTRAALEIEKLFVEKDISDSTPDLITKGVSALKKAIAKAVKELKGDCNKDVLPSLWDKTLERKSVKVKRVDGKVQITFDEAEIGTKVSEALYQVLSN